MTPQTLREKLLFAVEERDQLRAAIYAVEDALKRGPLSRDVLEAIVAKARA